MGMQEQIIKYQLAATEQWRVSLISTQLRTGTGEVLKAKEGFGVSGLEVLGRAWEGQHGLDPAKATDNDSL